MTAPSSPHDRTAFGVTPGTSGYRRAIIGAFCAGLASFNAMYATQAVLPSLSTYFHTSPTLAALTISATTGALALAVIPMGTLSQRVGKRALLQCTLLVATALSLLLAIMPSIGALIAVRAVQGVAIAGVPAVIMAYLTEEIHPQYLARVMGFYISGTTLGGLIGRLVPGFALEFFSWRAAVFAGAIVALSMAYIAATVLPAQQRSGRRRISWVEERTAYTQHLRNPTLLMLFALPFLMMGAFVSLYNYLGFRLISAFALPESVVAFIFLLYLSGTWSSARAGSFIQRFGRARVLGASAGLATAGLLLLLIPWLWSTLIATLIFTASFFAAHSTASAWVAQVAAENKVEASSLYILSYYVGSSVIGAVSGFFFSQGWWVLVLWLCALYSLSFYLAIRLQRAVSAGSSRFTRAGDPKQ